MFGRKRQEEKLRALEQELWEAEEDTDEEEYDEEDWEDEDPDEEDWDDEDPDEDEEYWDDEDEDAYLEYDLSEEEELERSFFGQRSSRYKRGNPKKFYDNDFFEDGFDDGDVLFRRDYKKAKRKQRRKKLGLFLLALVELSAIVLLILWWTSWKL